MTMDLRHEYKHEISPADAFCLRRKLMSVMQQDPHAINGSYKIRSLYFDNLYDKALSEKINGVNMREKFRLRFYNEDPSYIMLEKKSKINGLCRKEQIRLTVAETENLLATDWTAFSDNGNALVNELLYKMRTDGLMPKTIVDYTREPYIYAPGNVRVTLDYDIRTGISCTDFLNTNCVTVPARDAPVILEVKWDSFLPDIIRDVVQLKGTGTSAFSKYALCRTYG